jgi:hypothetical protein
LAMFAPDAAYSLANWCRRLWAYQAGAILRSAAIAAIRLVTVTQDR